MSNMTTAQKISIGFGIVYLLVGILGFVPAFNTPGSQPGETLLLGIFAVNFLHNVAHLLFAALLILGGMSASGVVTINKILAVIFAILVVGTFIPLVNNLVALNIPDLVLHLGSMLITGYVGFAAGNSAAMRTAG